VKKSIRLICVFCLMFESIISAEGTELKADLNNDGIVNFADLAILTNDGIVNFADLAILANEWLNCGSAVDYYGKHPAALFVEDFSDKDEGGWSSPQTMRNTTEFSICGKTSIMVLTAGSNENQTRYAYLYKDYGAGFEKNWDKCSFRFRYYIPAHMAYMPQYCGLGLRFYRDGGDVNMALWSTLPHAPGWNDVEIAAAGLEFFGDMHDMSVVRRFAICSWIPAGVTDAHGEFSGPSNPWYVVCDCLEVWADDTSDNGAVIFQFDDGYLSSYEKGIKYLASKGLPSMMYVSGESVGRGTGDDAFCTWEQLDEAAMAGCMICPHSQSNTPVDTIEHVRSFYEQQIAYLRDHGHLSGLRYWAIPSGQVKWWDTALNPVLTPSQQMDIAREYFVNIRGTNRYWIDVDDYDGNGGSNDSRRPWGLSGAIPCRPKNVHWASIWHVNKSESFNDDMIERVAANKGLLLLAGHRIGSSNPNDPSEAVYQAAVDKCLSEGLKVITLEDVVMGRDW